MSEGNYATTLATLRKAAAEGNAEARELYFRTAEVLATLAIVDAMHEIADAINTFPDGTEYIVGALHDLAGDIRAAAS